MPGGGAVPYHAARTGPLMLQSQSPALAILAVLVCMFFAAAIAGIVGRMVNSAVGVFVLGAGVFVLGSRMSGASLKCSWVRRVSLLEQLQ